MSSVLYDAPGPRARRRELLGSFVAAAVLLALAYLAVMYAADRGVFGVDRWDVLWNPQRGANTAADVWRSLLVQGLGATLGAAVVAAPLALLLGVVIAVWRRARFFVVRAPAAVGVEVFRGLPVLLMMFFAQLVFGWSAFESVVFGLVAYNMAIFAEILRAGLASLPKGQAEASYAVGMTRWQTLTRIELPQAVRTMTPSLIAQLVVLLKDSSLGFIVGYAELLRVIQRNSLYFGERYYIALFVVGAVIYLIINISLSQLAIRIQRRGLKSAPAPADPSQTATLPAGVVVLDPTGGKNVQ